LALLCGGKSNLEFLTAWFKVPVKTGKRTSIIGLATSTTGMPDSWKDQGQVKNFIMGLNLDTSDH